MAVVLSTKIQNDYADILKKKIEAANQATAASKTPYQYNITQAGSTYQPVRNQAYTDNMASARALRERMANMGIAGGASQRKQYDLASDLKTNINAANLEQQKYVDEQNTQMSQLDAQNQASIANLTAENTLAMNQALANQQNIDNQRALALYLARRLSKADYQKITGVTW